MVFHMLSSVVALALVDGMPDINEIEINEFDDVDSATIPCNLKYSIWSHHRCPQWASMDLTRAAFTWLFCRVCR